MCVESAVVMMLVSCDVTADLCLFACGDLVMVFVQCCCLVEAPVVMTCCGDVKKS